MQQDLAHICFRDGAWIQARGGLGAHNVMEYFSLSQFYDRTCNNEVAKMQTQFTQQQASQDPLLNMVGMEYVLGHVQEPILFVIRKQHRTSPTAGTFSAVSAQQKFYISVATVVNSYCVIDGAIYQSPSLYSLLQSRLSTAAYHLDKAIDLLMENSEFHPNFGHAWLEEVEIGGETDQLEAAEQQLTAEQQLIRASVPPQRIDGVLEFLSK